jgi:TPP-dependent pyruvate/acetoin dehydrogenase alpha subunit
MKRRQDISLVRSLILTEVFLWIEIDTTYIAKIKRCMKKNDLKKKKLMQMPDNKIILKIYEQMLRIRFFEQKANELFAQGLVTGSMHLYIGQEAIAATAGELLRETDTITSTHRGHGHCIAKGGKTNRMMAELLGRKNGYCSGKGGSMHMTDFTMGNLGANGMVGGGLAIAVGAGITNAIMKKNDSVTICFFGEGATNEGVFHESLNLASLWKLPVIFLCENNLYQVFTSVDESLSVKDVSVRAASYGIPGITCDGNDVFELYDVLGSAIERARNGHGPTLIEAKTYRWEGHYTGDGYARGGYRSIEEVEEWKDKDPIERFSKYIIEKNIADSNYLEKIRIDLKDEMEKSAKYAIESPWPDDNDLYKDVFYEMKEV